MPQAPLGRYVKIGSNSANGIQIKLGKKSFLPPHLKEELVDCLNMKCYFSLAMNGAICLVYKLAQRNNIQTHFLMPDRGLEKLLYDFFSGTPSCHDELPEVYPILKLYASLQKSML
jgi:hypothetical protein